MICERGAVRVYITITDIFRFHIPCHYVHFANELYALGRSKLGNRLRYHISELHGNGRLESYPGIQYLLPLRFTFAI